MNIKVINFIQSNNNNGVRWRINGTLYEDCNTIPAEIMEQYVIEWIVIQIEGIIEITTSKFNEWRKI